MNKKSIKNTIEWIFTSIIIIIFFPFWIIYILLCKKCEQCGTLIHAYPLKKNGQKAIKNEFKKNFCSTNCKKKWEKEEEKRIQEDLKDYQKESREYVCRACEYKWQSRKSFGYPSICPHCKNQNIEKYSETKEGRKDWKKMWTDEGLI